MGITTVLYSVWLSKTGIYYYSYYKVNYFKILCYLLYSSGKTIVTIYNFRGFFDFFLTFT